MVSEERGPEENIKIQIAIGVRNIQWSYAIFWSISTRQQGVLEWCEGYYNGDIKTRKTLQAMELNSDQMGLQRSEDLRELYESLSEADPGPHTRRPSASLSPEDLSDAEWYYLVCMSFVFNFGQGLPGRALANGQPIWLYNAHSADSKVFSRSLLAKSASIQTVVCFPFLGGVIEIGVSDLVLEDYTIIHRFKKSVLNCNFDQDPNFSSPSNDLEPLDESLIMVEGINGADCRDVMDDEDLSNCVDLDSMDSSDCISQTLSIPKHETIDEEPLKQQEPCQGLEDYNYPKMPSLDLQTEDLHYRGVIATLFKGSNQLILGPHFHNLNNESSFVRWKMQGGGGGLGFGKKPSKCSVSQRLVKKILFEVPRMHVNRDISSPEEIGDFGIRVWRPEADEIGSNHAMSERKRREKLNEKFSVLKTLIPSLTKDDKVSILDDAIEYLKELEKRVEELESCKVASDSGPKTRRKSLDSSEGMSDNYGNKKISSGKKPLLNKRKARDIYGEVVPKDSSVHNNNNTNNNNNNNNNNIAVKMKNTDIVIEIKCRWRDGVLLEIMDALSDLRLDSHSVQSSTLDGIISLNIKSMIKGPDPISSVTIKQALQRVTRKC